MSIDRPPHASEPGLAAAVVQDDVVQRLGCWNVMPSELREHLVNGRFSEEASKPPSLFREEHIQTRSRLQHSKSQHASGIILDFEAYNSNDWYVLFL